MIDKVFRDLLSATRATVAPYADFTDAQLTAASRDGGAHIGADLQFPITPELARLVLSLRAALRAFDEAAR
jgi:hypothetical protein